MDHNPKAMSNTKFYIESSSYGRYPNLDFIHKVNKEYDICIHSDYTWKPCIWASIARHSPVDDTVPKSEDGYKIKRISEEQFNEYFNSNYNELQEMNVKSGDYFLERSKNDNSFVFHAFFQKPSKHIKICCHQGIDNSGFSMERENTISIRPMTKKRGLHINEELFCKVYKIVLEFLYTGSSMPSLQDKVFQAVKGLLDPARKPMEVVIAQESYYKKARDLMLQRKDELKARLVELDDKPSTRRELRAQMKAIDYCVSILDKYH